jgi:hypothetical protein
MQSGISQRECPRRLAHEIRPADDIRRYPANLEGRANDSDSGAAPTNIFGVRRLNRRWVHPGTLFHARP